MKNNNIHPIYLRVEDEDFLVVWPQAEFIHTARSCIYSESVFVQTPYLMLIYPLSSQSIYFNLHASVLRLN